MARFAIHAERFFLPGTPVDGGYLVIEDGRFVGWQAERPEGEVREYRDRWVAPGFVDTHVHGMFDHDVMDCDARGVAEISKGIPRFGVTSWTPTTLTATTEQLSKACVAVAEAKGKPGARIQGIFLEGPFFTERHAGAQNPKYFCDPSIDKLGAWQESADGLISKIAVAPERDGVMEFCRGAERAGVVVALGHSDATYEQTISAVNAGASVFVHTFNGMNEFLHRAPGLPGAALAARSTYAELICDGHHVVPAAARAFIAAKGFDHVVLITDCMRAGGMPDGDYKLGELPVVVADGTARLKDGGNLAGSILTLDQAVRNVVAWGAVTPEQAIRMASENPARANGIGGVCGSILPGRAADLVVLSRELRVAETYVGGKSLFRARV
ncbi:MAG: N-acetylglucosamine-6-phosphate deacetylase [Atopobiaceae bacterium]|jgi:N-acetylglucosamine-6-phosphate deacetylase|nr:N-acetylglucosamine-6-phosphate deacetylase [Atopobiaceae bacterium]